MLSPKAHNLIGKVFGRLTVTGPYERRIRPDGSTTRLHWTCRCECGTITTVDAAALKGGHTLSCGCLQIERSRAALTQHGHARVSKRTREYRAWDAMVQRCTNPNDGRYKWYGARGVTIICQQWINDAARFIADMGPCPPKHQIERINNDGNYEPSNCRWASSHDQARNTRHNRLVTLGEVTLCLSDWSQRTGLKRETIAYRLNKGWPAERALSEPIH